MISLFIFQIGLCFAYLLLIGWVATIWDIIPETIIPKSYKPVERYSIIIPFKDELGNIEPCIQSLLNLAKGPEYEIICIDDGSDDGGFEKIKHLPIKLLKANGKGKKQAICQGIEEAQYDWIITVDADCLCHKDWLKLIDVKIQEENCDVLIGPVKMSQEQSLLSSFQSMDIAATMGTTAAGIESGKFYLSNGANFIYKKQCFDNVNGFEGNEHIASGDDVFLLKKFCKISDFKIGFLKSDRAAVVTKTESTWKALFNQRKRWATKSSAYANLYIWAIQGLIFLLSLLIVLNFFVLPFLIGDIAIIIGMFVVFIKATIDFLYLHKMSFFFKRSETLKHFIPAFFIFTTYYLLMGLQAIFPSKVNWKGRKV